MYNQISGGIVGIALLISCTKLSLKMVRKNTRNERSLN